jgi:hypothetical protein
MKFFFAIALIFLTVGTASAGHLWVNNITVNEHDITWSYTETFTGLDSMSYRIGIDTELGNNDSFVNAWELLLADKEIRKELRKSIDSELDVRIDNQTSGIEVLDVDSKLSPDIIGKTHVMDAIVNKYNVTYKLRDSIFNASSIWFLGQTKSSITIVMPARVDVVNIRGMDNVTNNVKDHVEITGFFKQVSGDRGEVLVNITKNMSFKPVNVSLQASDNITKTNVTKPVAAMVSKMRDVTFLIAGAVIIILIYVFKVKRR